MAWTAPRTWVTGEIVTAALGNTHWRDTLRYLKGLDGVPTIESGLIIDNAGGDEYLQIPSLTTAERDALTPVNGMIIYNETTTEFNKYEAGAWVDLADNTDHGGLDGLGDDDHTQYQKENLLTTQGDTIYATAASTWARLAKGTGGQFLKMNAGATAPEWGTGASNAKIISVTRVMTTATGDQSYTGVGFTPKAIIMFGGTTASYNTRSWGIADENLLEWSYYVGTGLTDPVSQQNILATAYQSSGNQQQAILKSMDADGFTLTWTKTGTPGETATFYALCLG